MISFAGSPVYSGHPLDAYGGLDRRRDEDPSNCDSLAYRLYRRPTRDPGQVSGHMFQVGNINLQINYSI